MTMTWRTRGHSRFVEPGEWQTSQGDVRSVDGETGVPLLFFPDLQDEEPDGQWDMVSPFPNPDCDYADCRIASKLKLKKIPAPQKRDRTAELAAPEANAPQNVATAMAQALLDGKINKITTPVPAGDGLRIPKAIPVTFACFYPPLYILRRAQGESATTLEREWAEAFEKTRQHFGAIFKMEINRLNFATAVQNVITRIHDPSSPSSKEQWRLWFNNAFQAAHEMVVVCHGSRAAEKILKKLRDGFAANLVDFEDAWRSVEEDTQLPPPQPTTQPNITQLDARAIQTEVQALKTTTSELVKQINNTNSKSSFRPWRGRGRGRGSAQ